MKYVGISAPLYSFPKSERNPVEIRNEDFPGPNHYSISPGRKKVAKRTVTISESLDKNGRKRDRRKPRNLDPGPGDYHTCYPKESCNCWVYLENESQFNRSNFSKIKKKFTIF